MGYWTRLADQIQLENDKEKPSIQSNSIQYVSENLNPRFSSTT